MSYTDRDQSEEDGNPLLLFKFVQGSTTYRYCLSTESVFVDQDGHTWTPAVIVPGEFSFTNDAGKDALQIELADDDPLALTFKGGIPDSITTLTVFRVFTDPATSLEFYWKGRVNSTGMGPGRVLLTCDSIATMSKRPGLRLLSSKTCGHVLFGRGCNLSSVNFQYNCTIRQAAGDLITLPANSARDGYWDGGILTFSNNGISRMIMAHRGGKLKLIRPFPVLNAYVAAHQDTGALVWLYRGCDHTFKMCVERYNNGGNFGGRPWRADRNPFSSQVSIA